MSARRGHPIGRLSRLTRWLLLFALASLAANLALEGVGSPTTLRQLRYFASATQGVDSWRPMNIAYVYLTETQAGARAERPLYDWLFFERRIKFIYPPTSLLLFDLLPRDVRREALNLLTWLVVLATAAFVGAVFDRALQTTRFAAKGRLDRAVRIGIVVFLSLTFNPVMEAYSLGQMQVFANALFAAGVWCWLVGYRGSAGVLVVLMSAVKPQYGLIALWGIVRRERRFVAGAAITGVLLGGLSLARFGWEHHLDYLRVVSHVSRVGEAYWPNQTPNGFLNRLLGNGVSAHWDPRVYPPYDATVHLLTLAAGIALLGAGLWPVRGAARGGVLDFGAMALATTIASPIAWEHHYGVLLPLFALLLPALLEAGAPRRALALLALAYAVAANHIDVLGRLSDTPWNPLQSLLLFAALGILAVLMRFRADPPPELASRAAAGPGGSVRAA